MRFLSSVALERTPRLRLAASCSAAEAMWIPLSCRLTAEAGIEGQLAWARSSRWAGHARRPGSTVRTRRARARRALPPRRKAHCLAAGASCATVVVIVPPACSTAAIAAADAPDTVMVIARVSSPLAQQPHAVQPAAHQTGRPQRVLGDRLRRHRACPPAIAFSSAPRFTGAYSLRNRFLKPRLGRRR